MTEYLVLHVKDDLPSSRDQVTNLPTATTVMNQHAAQGWRVVSCVPGTNAASFSGVIITFERD